LRGWLIYRKADAKENEAYIDWFIDEAKKQGLELRLVYRENLNIGLKDNKPIVAYSYETNTLPDFVIIRTVDSFLQNTFETLSIPCFNPFSVANLANHKSWTYLKIAKLNIPVLETYFTTKSAFPTIPPLSYPFVVKEATGRGGKQVFYIEDDNDWIDVKDKVQSEDIVVQEASVQLGRDLRVFVLGKSIVAAVLRENNSDFRANYKLGGSARLYTLTEKDEKMIQRIIDNFDFGLVGIDFFLNKRNELIFNEIEDVVGSRILSATTDINLLALYVEHIKTRLGVM